MAEQEAINCSIEMRGNICFINGALSAPLATVEHIKELQNRKIRDSDIILCSFPKTGTHWLIHILRLLVYKEKITLADEHKHCFLDMPMLEKFPLESEIQSNVALKFGVCKEEFENRKPPRIMFSHLLFDFVPKHPDAKYLYMYRNPKDIILSAFNHFNNFSAIELYSGTFEGLFDMFIETELFGFIQHLECYFKHKSNPNFMFLSYEELQANFKVKVYEIAAFIGVEMTEELYKLVVQETEFKTMQQNDVVNLKFAMKEGENFLWKGVAGQWKEALTPEQIKAVDDVLREKLDEEFLKQLNFL